MSGQICRYDAGLWNRVGMRHPGGRESTGRLVQLAERFRRKESGKKLLNICCGDGEGMDLFRDQGYEVTGIDRLASLTAQAKERFPEMNWICADVDSLSNQEEIAHNAISADPQKVAAHPPGAIISREAYDIILSECSLTEAENLDRRLEWVFHALKRGGLFVTADIIETGEEEQKRWSAAFERAGFSGVYQEMHEEWLRQFYASLLWEADETEQKDCICNWEKWKNKSRCGYLISVYRRC